MILDTLKNAGLYSHFGSRFTAAFDYLRTAKFEALGADKHPIQGDDVFALRVDGPTHTEEKGVWETHRRYVDIHYIAGGGEAMGYAPIESMKPTTPYHEGDDYMLFSGKGRFIALEPGDFMILFPHDVHMPDVDSGAKGPLQKIVIKVRV